MRALLTRLAGHNLSKLWLRETTTILNMPRILLLPQTCSVLSNRGAKVDSGIIWVRPVEPECIDKAKSGDLEGLTKIDPNTIIPELRNSEVLKSAPPEVQKLFSFDFMASTKRKEIREEMYKDKVRRHQYDTNSPEVKLAKYTAKIRNLQIHMAAIPLDKKNKIVLKELIEKRKRRLKWLRMYDYKRFEWVLEQLNLVYYPPPPAFHPVMRSVSMTQLAETYAEDIKQARLEKYRIELEERKPEFLLRKIQTMQSIIADEKALNISPSFTEEDIKIVEKQYQDQLETVAKIPKPVKDIF